MPNPFVAKVKKPKNPFASKVKKTAVDTPAAKRNGNNPFATRAKEGKAERLAEIERMITEAEERYEESLAKALKGISRDQTNQRFNISDRHMHTLLNLTAQRKRIVEGTEIRTTTWGSKQKKQQQKKATETPKPEKKSPSQSLKTGKTKQAKPKPSPSKPPAPKGKPKVNIRLAAGSATRTHKRN